MANHQDKPQSKIPEELRRYLKNTMHYLGPRQERYENPSDTQTETTRTTARNGNTNLWLQEYQSTYPDSDFINSRGTTKIGDFNRSPQGYYEVEVPRIRGPDSQQSNLAMEMGMGEIQKSQYELEEQIKFMEDRLSNLSFKLSETRKSNKQLKTDIKLTNSLLRQELDESTGNVQSVKNYGDSTAGSYLRSSTENPNK